MLFTFFFGSLATFPLSPKLWTPADKLRPSSELQSSVYVSVIQESKINIYLLKQLRFLDSFQIHHRSTIWLETLQSTNLPQQICFAMPVGTRRQSFIGLFQTVQTLFSQTTNSWNWKILLDANMGGTLVERPTKLETVLLMWFTWMFNVSIVTKGTGSR